jgi:SAM-dependent methyltransferase
MSRIAYDPLKDRLAKIVRDKWFLRTLFYRLLNLFFLRSWYIRRLLHTYGPSITQNEKWNILDAGCGFGQYDEFILRRFPDSCVSAVDVKEQYLEDCRQYFKREIEQERASFNKGNLLTLEPSDNFDLALCVDVLEHIEDDELAIKNIGKSLKSGGYFIMHSPSIYSAKDAGGDEESFVDEHARTGYSKEDLGAKLNNAGFEVVEMNYTYGEKGHLAWQWIIQYPMLWMNRWNLWALPFLALYYLFTLPMSLVLMKLDMMDYNEEGTGIYAVAVKSRET